MKNIDANFFENNTLVLNKKEYLHSSNEKVVHVGYNVNNSFFFSVRSFHCFHYRK